MSLNWWPSVTVVIPSIPPRAEYLIRAVKSVTAQDYKGMLSISIDIDNQKTGATATRWRALKQARGDFVAFLDDDDEFYPHHLSAIIQGMHDASADYGYSWFDVIGGTDPFPPVHETTQWTDKIPIQTTVTTVVDRHLALRAYEMIIGEKNAESPRPTPDGHRAGEDWAFTLNCLSLGAKIHHILGKRTWAWHHHGMNTSGLPENW